LYREVSPFCWKTECQLMAADRLLTINLKQVMPLCSDYLIVCSICLMTDCCFLFEHLILVFMNTWLVHMCLKLCTENLKFVETCVESDRAIVLMTKA